MEVQRGVMSDQRSGGPCGSSPGSHNTAAVPLVITARNNETTHHPRRLHASSSIAVATLLPLPRPIAGEEIGTNAQKSGAFATEAGEESLGTSFNKTTENDAAAVRWIKHSDLG